MAEEKELKLSEQEEVLLAFSRTLNREANKLIERPDLLWQQLYNRLQRAAFPVKEMLSAALDCHRLLWNILISSHRTQE